ncbi:MAG: hypothetical protein JO281_02395 [Pseudonocardiales bacterium]|nr:hypothetical protein [Pseudonocardiales bacterium]
MKWRAVLTWVRDCFGVLDRVAAIARALDLANKEYRADLAPRSCPGC